MSFIYLCRELRQRRSQAIMVAFGIGLGLAGSWLVWVFFPSFDARSGVIGDAFAEPASEEVSRVFSRRPQACPCTRASP